MQACCQSHRGTTGRYLMCTLPMGHQDAAMMLVQCNRHRRLTRAGYREVTCRMAEVSQSDMVFQLRATV